MPTVRTVTVKPSAGDYPSLSAANAGEQALANDLPTADRQLDIACYAMDDTASVAINGWTTDATRYIRVYAASGQGHSGTWSTSKYRHRSNDGFGNGITIREEYVRLEGLQFYQPSGSYASLVRCQVSASPSDVRIDRCLFNATGTTINAVLGALYHSDGTLTLSNSVIYGSTSRGIAAIQNTFSPDISCENVTVAACGTYGFFRSQGTMTLRNCYSGGNGTDAYNGTMTLTTCMHSSATSFTGSTGSIAYSTANFVNVTSGSEDLHLTSGSALINQGTTTSYTTDIDGNTRTGTFDVGADEFVSTNTTLTAATGSFSLSGQAAGLKAALKLSTAKGTFSEAGNAAALKAAFKLAAAPGSFAISGQAAIMKASPKLTATAGAFIESGQVALLKAAFKLTAAAGAFSEAGQTAALKAAFKLTAAAGVFSESGQAAGLKGAFQISAGTGAYGLTGNDANLVVPNAYVLTADPGSFAENGQEAILQATFRLTAGAGSFVESGQAATLKIDRKLSAATGAFVLTGNDAGLIVPNAFVLSAATGAFGASGQPALLKATRTMTAARGVFSLTASDATLQALFRLTASPGSFSIAGYPVIGPDDLLTPIAAYRVAATNRVHRAPPANRVWRVPCNA